MTTQKRLEGIKQYFQSIQQYEGKWIICVTFPDNWTTFPSKNNTIEAIQDENDKNTWWYCGTNTKNNTDVEIDDIIDLIELTIETNKEALKKLELLKKKREELQELFCDPKNSFRKLQTLKFIMDDNADTKAKLPKALKNKNQTRPKNSEKMPSEATEGVKANTRPESVNNTVTEPKNDIVEAKETQVINATDMSQEEINDLRG